MLTGLENFVFGHFKNMPLSVRIFTYLFILFLFAYLLLVPKFINGRLELGDGQSEGWIPYRAGVLQMHVEGRVYKFKVSAEGYWSVPNVSLLPGGVHLEVYHVDQDRWFPVELKWRDLWTRDLFRIAVMDQPASVKLVTSGAAGTRLPSRMLARLGRMAKAQPSMASAGELVLSPIPPNVPPVALDPQSSRMIEAEVLSTVHSVAGTAAGLTFPLTGPSAPTYGKRIKIIESLQDKFDIVIPDEHWPYLNTVGELVDYVQKRKLAERIRQELLPLRHRAVGDESSQERQREPAYRPRFKR